MMNRLPWPVAHVGADADDAAIAEAREAALAAAELECPHERAPEPGDVLEGLLRGMSDTEVGENLPRSPLSPCYIRV